MEKSSIRKPRLSVTVITLNEEKNIKRCLDSIKEIADEIVIIDSGSTDRTVEIAKEYNARIYYRKFDDMGIQKNFAAGKSTAEWILALDADEVITKKLSREIRKATEDARFNGYLIPRRNIILGAEIKHTRWSPDKHIWLWKKGFGKWLTGVHSEVEVKGKVGDLKNAKIHYQYDSIHEFFSMINKYTESEANELVEKGIGFSYFKLFYFPLRSFVGRFVYKKGYLDGWRGFILSYLMAVYRLAMWIKVWKKQ